MDTSCEELILDAFRNAENLTCLWFSLPISFFLSCFHVLLCRIIPVLPALFGLVEDSRPLKRDTIPQSRHHWNSLPQGAVVGTSLDGFGKRIR